jgi:16S rRNA (adenine1518-N6/adenine1519-N6)-dimethyltransferase
MTTKKVSNKKNYRDTDSLLARTTGLLRRAGLRAKKGLGQHFLIDEEVLSSILSAAQLTVSDTVLEVGPGLGVLTAKLVEQAGSVVAIELDEKLAMFLKESLSSYDNINIVNEDVLKVSVATLLEGHSKGYKVVANLPYYITSPVLRHFLEADIQPQVMVVMVQKEVAEEITAEPGKMSLLSIGVQLYGKPEIIEYVPARCFYPEPEVDSAVLKVVPYTKPPVEITDREGFFALVRAGFSAARKQLANSLAQGLSIPKADALSLLEKGKIESQRRAETLSIEEWAYLWRVYNGKEGE